MRRHLFVLAFILAVAVFVVTLGFAVMDVVLSAQGRKPSPPPSSIWQECLAVQNGTSRGVILTDATTGQYLGSVRPYSANRICD